jgi:hypothetical protein
MRKQTNKHAESESESEVFSKSESADFREVRGLGLGLGRPKSSAFGYTRFWVYALLGIGAFGYTHFSVDFCVVHLQDKVTPSAKALWPGASFQNRSY